jgi:hypothetical protein
MSFFIAFLLSLGSPPFVVVHLSFDDRRTAAAAGAGPPHATAAGPKPVNGPA